MVPLLLYKLILKKSLLLVISIKTHFPYGKKILSIVSPPNPLPIFEKVKNVGSVAVNKSSMKPR